MTFKRGKGGVLHDYSIDGSVLRRVDESKDLGIVMTSTLSPERHLNYIVNRASSLVGFIMRSTRDFNSPRPLVILYKTLVRPIMEYGSILWSPYQLGHQDMLNKIQIRFVRLLGCRIGFDYIETPIKEVEELFDLKPLQLRRTNLDLFFLYKLVNGLLDCPALLSGIDFTIPRGTRSGTIFRRRFEPCYYAYHHGTSRLLRLGSIFAPQLNFFGVSANSFKREVQRLLQ